MIAGNVTPRSTAPCSDVGVLARITGIDGKIVATTNLYTVPANMRAVVLAAVIHVTAADTITVVGAAGIGVAAGEDDIFPSATLTGLDAVDEAWFFAQGAATRKAATAAQVIKFGIDTGYTATIATLAVDLIGYVIRV